jgi:SWI/SNF-related matrix-associated actin-dependent regulator 1 of chromatin subfamily A
MQSSRTEYIGTQAEAESKKKKTKKELAKSQSSLSNVLMQLRKAANHQLLMRKHYTDEMIPSIAKDIMRELEFMDNNYQYIIEDMKVMSDFELHKLCIKHPVTFFF